MLRSAALVCLAVVAATGLVACTAPHGALVSLDEGETTVCAPADAAGRAVFGVSQLLNTSKGDVTVVSATLIAPESLELLGLALPSGDDPDAQVVGLPYDMYGPQPFSTPLTIPAGETVTVLAGLAGSVGLPGSTAGVTISYEVDGQRDTATVATDITMQVVPAGEVCGGP